MRLGIHVVSNEQSMAATIRDALHALFPTSERLPASTWLGITSLALEGLLIEVEAEAVVELDRGGS